jgi:hypothetical protein
MEALNLIGNICSIASLIIAIFIASKIIKIDNSNKTKQTGNQVINGTFSGRDNNITHV